LEHHLLNRAARIIVPSRIAKEQMIKDYRFLEHEDVMIIPAGFDRDDMASVNLSIVPSSTMTIMHTGKADMTGHLPAFLQGFASVLKTSPEIQRDVMISFPGIVDDSLTALIDKLGIRENVHQPGYIAHRDLFQTMSKADILLTETKSMYQIPRKIYEYIAMRKPLAIIAPEYSALAGLAKESGASLLLHDAQASSIETYIRSLHSAWKIGKLPIQVAGFSETFAMDNYVDDLSIALTKAIRIS
jgi:glycosyltransferase involved in cell wall biosynthesis